MKALALCWTLLCGALLLTIFPGMVLEAMFDGKFERAGEILLLVGLGILFLVGIFAFVMMIITAAVQLGG